MHTNVFVDFVLWSHEPRLAKQAAPLSGFQPASPTLHYLANSGMLTSSIEPVHSQGLEQPVFIGPNPPLDMSVRVFSRRKADDPQHHSIKGRLPLHIDRNAITALFGQPQALAAQHLGISVTALKKTCRKLGVMRWPHCGRKCTTRM